MLDVFDQMVLETLDALSHPYSDLMSDQFCASLRGPGALQDMRTHTLAMISHELARVYEKDVVVLIDEYDTPMHSALEHNYTDVVRSFILLLQLPQVIPGQRVLFYSIRFAAEGSSVPMLETPIDVF